MGAVGTDARAEIRGMANAREAMRMATMTSLYLMGGGYLFLLKCQILRNSF